MRSRREKCASAAASSASKARLALSPAPTRPATWSSSTARADSRLISAVNLTEVLVGIADDRQRLLAAWEAIAALGVTIHQPSEAIGVESARLRGAHPISLPDAYCLATARHRDAALASFDEKVLRAAEREGRTTVEASARRRR
jgi:predicted nucleic acid-binding protein